MFFKIVVVLILFDNDDELMIIIVAIELSKGDIEGIEIEFIDISILPMLNTDLENNGTYPPQVEAFRHKILQADSFLFASPEYNYSVTGTILDDFI